MTKTELKQLEAALTEAPRGKQLRAPKHFLDAESALRAEGWDVSKAEFFESCGGARTKCVAVEAFSPSEDLSISLFTRVYPDGRDFGVSAEVFDDDDDVIDQFEFYADGSCRKAFGYA